MKTSKKIFLLSILISSLVLNSSFSFSDTKDGYEVNTGIFKTSDDYLNQRLTVYYILKLKNNTFKGVLNGKKIPSTPYKNADFWGAEDEDGLIYRINKKANVADQIISKGKIWYYAGQELVIERDNYGDVKGMGINVTKGAKFSEVFWVSLGCDGDMIGASIQNLSILFYDAPDLVAKMKKKGLDETTVDKWVDNFKTVNSWIAEYNKAHN